MREPRLIIESLIVESKYNETQLRRRNAHHKQGRLRKRRAVTRGRQALVMPKGSDDTDLWPVRPPVCPSLIILTSDEEAIPRSRPAHSAISRSNNVITRARGQLFLRRPASTIVNGRERSPGALPTAT